jgi:response regulator RpfG family c-di-GMP phosphodiesterase
MDKGDLTILYVDDEDTNLFIFNLTFGKKYTVHTAIGPEEGFEKLKEFGQDIQVVISDMRMPAMNGTEFIRKAKVNYPYLLYYILTGFDYNEEIEKALEENLIQACFTKPFEMEEIEAAIFQALDQK